MMEDVWTVIWKESKELLGQDGGLRGGKLRTLVIVGVFGVFLPLQSGRGWVESPMSLLYWAWVPLMLVMTVIADSIAGERERHTLESLLSSCLSDRAILFGKVGAAVGFGWGLTMIALLVGLVTVNVAYSRGELLLYSPAVGLGAVVLSLLAAGLAATAGVLVSLRASTVRQAQQTLMIPMMLVIFVPVFGLRMLPSLWRAHVMQFLATASLTTIVVLVVAALALLDAGLLTVAMARFQRSRLILD